LALKNTFDISPAASMPSSPPPAPLPPSATAMMTPLPMQPAANLQPAQCSMALFSSRMIELLSTSALTLSCCYYSISVSLSRQIKQGEKKSDEIAAVDERNKRKHLHECTAIENLRAKKHHIKGSITLAFWMCSLDVRFTVDVFDAFLGHF
jgi:hypothetical protein